MSVKCMVCWITDGKIDRYDYSQPGKVILIVNLGEF